VFRKGDKVVHPRHGAAVVEDLVALDRLGDQRIYVKLRLPPGLTLMVPVESTEQVICAGGVGTGSTGVRSPTQDRRTPPLGQEVQGAWPSSCPATSTTCRGRPNLLGRGGKGLSSGEADAEGLRDLDFGSICRCSTEVNAEAMLEEVRGRQAPRPPIDPLCPRRPCRGPTFLAWAARHRLQPWKFPTTSSSYDVTANA
jgi:hypothetical protein